MDNRDTLIEVILEEENEDTWLWLDNNEGGLKEACRIVRDLTSAP